MVFATIIAIATLLIVLYFNAPHIEVPSFLLPSNLYSFSPFPDTFVNTSRPYKDNSTSVRHKRSLPSHTPSDKTIFTINNKQTHITRDLIFTEKGNTILNPNYVSHFKSIDLTSFEPSITQLSALHDRHIETCAAMDALDGPTSNSVIRYIYLNTSGDHSAAQQACDNEHMMLPEILTHYQLHKFQDFLRKANLQSAHAGVYISRTHNDIRFFRNHSSAWNSLIPFCYRDIFHHKSFEAYMYYSGVPSNVNWIYEYYNPTSFHLCHEHMTNPKPRPIVCQSLPSIETALKSQTEFCKRRSHDIHNTIVTITGSYNNLVKQFQPANHGTLPTVKTPPAPPSGNVAALLQGSKSAHGSTRRKRFSSRRKRHIAVVISLISLLFTVLSTIKSHSVPTVVKQELDSIKFNTDTIATEVARLETNLATTLDKIQNADNLKRTEMAIYQSYIRILVHLNDEILLFRQTMQQIASGSVSDKIVTPTEISYLNQKALDLTSKPLVRNTNTYQVKPILVDDNLAIQVNIPVLTNERQVTLFDIEKIPTFINGTKYELDCKLHNIAIFQHSNNYQILSPTEFQLCLKPNHFCQSPTPKYSSDIHSCATDQFFLKNLSSASYNELPDRSPFFHTIGTRTLYSVPKPLTLSFHCASSLAGQDGTLRLSGRGNFTRHASCLFETANIAYSPGISIYTNNGSLLEPKSIFNFAETIKNFKYSFPFNIDINQLQKHLQLSKYIFPILLSMVGSVTVSMILFYTMRFCCTLNTVLNMLTKITNFCHPLCSKSNNNTHEGNPSSADHEFQLIMPPRQLNPADNISFTPTYSDSEETTVQISFPSRDKKRPRPDSPWISHSITASPVPKQRTTHTTPV